MNITPPKGRPMLYWVGKKPLETVKSYPTQLIEVYDPFNNTKFNEIPKYEDLEKNWHNLLFEGDNKEVLATLLELGFRGKIDLIYIDPPFASNKDYVRKVELRGFKGSRIESDEAPLLQQVMYEDIWKKDEYFQWIYERLLLMRELLSETGSIYVHLDYRMVHYVKLIMDEVFGEENFRNEIVWCYTGPSKQTKDFPDKHDIVLRYSKGDFYTFNPDAIRIPYKKSNIATGQTSAVGKKDEKYLKMLDERGKIPEDWWTDIATIGYKHSEIYGFSTQKPEALLERIIKASSNEGDLVLDCFIGSGTTAAVAQKLGRRWIGVDINKGAIQLTARRLRKIIEEQLKNNETLFEKHNKKYFTFAIYKVNDYELKLFQSEAKELAIRHLGIERTRTDPFFEGRLGNKLVKIIDFNHPLTLLDLEAIKEELSKRPEEVRDIVVVCYGKELSTQAWIEDWNRRAGIKEVRKDAEGREIKIRINQIEVIDLRADLEKGGFIIHEPPRAKVELKRTGETTARVEIKEFISPTVIKRFNLEGSLLQKVIKDFRSMIDFVLIDPDYDGKVFKAVFTDIPARKQDLIKGVYEIEVPPTKTKVAIKIVDVLGDELVVIKEI